MATTVMELKTKKLKQDKLGKATESEEITTQTMSAAISSIQSTKEPHSKTEAKMKRKSSETSEENSPPPNGSREPVFKKRKVSVEEIEVNISKPEPPSKKALRRLKKGKPLPPSKSGADTSPEPEDEEKEEGKPQKLEIEKRSEHGIWIGNLAWSVTKDDLRTFLTANSDIADETITRIHMPGPDNGKPAIKVEEPKSWKKQHNKGFAYVDFVVPEAVQQAVDLSEQLLSGRRVLIKDNKSFEGRPQKTTQENRNDGKPPSKRVFLGNLRFDTTEDSLKEHFERCGAIENIMVATFEDSGKCKGYAWITFEELEAAESVVRGYVFVQQEEEREDEEPGSESEKAYVEETKSGPENGNDEKRDDREEETKHKASKSKPIKPAMKRQWIDKIHGRPFRREFAEDAKVRYKKRYGKDGTKYREGKSSATAEADGSEARTHEALTPSDRWEGSNGTKKVQPSKKVEYRNTYAPRLTGGIVESKGKKVVF